MKYNALQNSISVSSRVIAAIFGGYIFSNSLSIFFSIILSLSSSNGVLTGMLMSFSIYTGAIIWVFAAKTALQAWLGLIIPCLVSIALIIFITPERIL